MKRSRLRSPEGALREGAPLEEEFHIAGEQRTAVDETWEQPWGEARFIRNHFNELLVELAAEGPAGRRMNVVFRAFDEGPPTPGDPPYLN